MPRERLVLNMEDDSLVSQTGEWWKRQWWLPINRTVHCDYSDESIAQAVDTLQRFFDAPWAMELAKAPKPNIIFPALCISRSTSALNLVAYLGEMFRTVQESPGFGRVVTDLKQDKSESALLELESAYAFATAGYSVRFPPEGSTKSADVIIELDRVDLAIECKRLRTEAWEHWEDLLTNSLIAALPWTKDGQQICVEVAMNPRLSHIRMTDDEQELNRLFLGAIVDEIAGSTREAVSGDQFPVEVVVPEVAVIRVASRDEGFGSISGMERSSAAGTRRILQNGVLRACQQLPPNTPGVAVIYSKTLPDKAFFKLFFEAACQGQRDRFSNLTCVLLCSLGTIAHASPPTILANPHTNFPHERDLAVGILKKTFGGLIDDPTALGVAKP